MTKENLIKLVETYLWRITHARDCLLLYKTIIDAKTTHLEEMNYAPAFFGITERSVTNDLFMTTSRLFDGTKGSMSIDKLINICCQNKELFLEERKYTYLWADTCDKEPYVEKQLVDMTRELSDAKAELNELADVVSNLKTRRDKYYAHSDKKYIFNPSSLQDDAPLCFNDLDRLLTFADKVCNNILCNLNMQVFLTQSSNASDLLTLLDKIHHSKIQNSST